jgi:integrase
MAGKPGHRGWGWIRRLPSGRYQASYLHHGHRHVAPTTFTHKTSAEGWLATERQRIEHAAIGGPPWTPPRAREAAATAAAVTLGEYGRTWIEQHPCKRSTRGQYEALFTKLIEPKLGAVPLRELTPAAVRSWRAGLERRKTPVRSATAVMLLRVILKTAQGDGLIAANPLGAGRLSAPASTVEPKVLSVAEIAKLADAVEAVNPRYRALVLIGAWTGLRWGELTELRRADVSDDATVIRVTRAADHHGGCHVDTPKSLARPVAVPEHIRADITHHLEHHTGAAADALLFSSLSTRGCGHLGNTTFRRAVWNAACTNAGLSGVRLHDMRHTAGTLNIAAGASLKESMDRLGHATMAASLRYQHVAANRDAEIAANLSKLAEGGDAS